MPEFPITSEQQQQQQQQQQQCGLNAFAAKACLIVTSTTAIMHNVTRRTNRRERVCAPPFIHLSDALLCSLQQTMKTSQN
jgi:hypothetical protein